MGKKLNHLFGMALVVLALLASACGSDRYRLTEYYTAQSYETAEILYQDYELPELMEDLLEDSPIMYDFLNGSMGWKSAYNPIYVSHTNYVLTWRADYEGTIFLSSYIPEKDKKHASRFPAIGRIPVEITLTDKEWELFSDYANGIHQRYQENNWIFIQLLDEHNMQYETYAALDEDGTYATVLNIRQYNDDSLPYAPMKEYVAEQGYPRGWRRY